MVLISALLALCFGSGSFPSTASSVRQHPTELSQLVQWGSSEWLYTKNLNTATLSNLTLSAAAGR